MKLLLVLLLVVGVVMIGLMKRLEPVYLAMLGVVLVSLVAWVVMIVKKGS